MATNLVQDGKVLTLQAPAGGVISGGIYMLGALAYIAITDAEADESFSARTDGVWNVPCATGLKAGAAVSVAAGKLKAVGEGAAQVGVLVTDEVGGMAHVLLK